MSPVRRSRATAHQASRVLGLTLLLGLALTSASCTNEDSSTPTDRDTSVASTAADPPATLEDVDTASLAVRRAPFCDQVAPKAVALALGEESRDATAYGSGDRVRVDDDLADVVHEYGCRWSAGSAVAEAWVFAPPVTRERARTLAKSAEGPGCRKSVPPASFGQPAAHCTERDGSTLTVRHHGLFGDAWLVCSLSLPTTSPSWSDEPEAAVQVRASQWCAAVAVAAAATPQ